AALIVGLAAVATAWLLADAYFAKTPEEMGQRADGAGPEASPGAAPGGTPGAAPAPGAGGTARPLPGERLWRDRRFATLAAGMALGLFAQVGLLAHLFSLLVPALGAQGAGFALGAATAAAIAGRTLVGWLMPARADRRLFGCASYGVQALGCLALL